MTQQKKDGRALWVTYEKVKKKAIHDKNQAAVEVFWRTEVKPHQMLMD